eukprot:TRINITY_DN18886_c0_g1_i1.p2 TRINITY_DN18886_c0_g1~~TRINITY_DN18886_c0_g1_i1.p2  ORF type:complete len:166 (-),score=26.73 TRINITY_DN18886_c0_g1_i1:144-641(-)
MTSDSRKVLSPHTVDCLENYKGPASQGLSAGITYLISYQTLFVARAANLDFSDPDVIAELLNAPEVTSSGSSLVLFMQPALELQLNQYKDDLQHFIDILLIIIWVKTGGFAGIFSLLFIFIFIYLVIKLTKEIWMNRGMLNIIPKSVLGHNMKMQEYAYKQKVIA